MHSIKNKTMLLKNFNVLNPKQRIIKNFVAFCSSYLFIFAAYDGISSVTSKILSFCSTSTSTKLKKKKYIYTVYEYNLLKIKRCS